MPGEIKRLKFSDGVTVTAPSTEFFNAGAFAKYADTAAYETAKGSAAADGDAFYNTTTDEIWYYSDGAWSQVIDNDSVQTVVSKILDGDDNTFQDLPLGAFKSTANTDVFIQRDGSGDVIDSPKAVPTGDVVGTSDAQVLSGKTIDGDDNTIQDLALSTLKTTANLDVFLQRDGSGDVVDSPKSVPTGDVVGTSDAQTLLNKTYTVGTASRALETDVSGNLIASAVTSTELGHLSGVSSNVQSQLDGKQADLVTTRGDIIVGDVAGSASRLGIGSPGQVLTSDGTDATWDTPAGTGDVTAAASITDNRLVRGDGGAKGIQQSGISVDDSDNLTGITGLTATGSIQGGTLTDGVLSTTAGAITGAVDVITQALEISSATPRLTLTDTDNFQEYYLDTAALSGRLSLFSGTDNEFLLLVASSSATGGNPLIQIGHTTGANDVRFEGFGVGVAHLSSDGTLSSSQIVDADVNALAAIDGNKIVPDFGSQDIDTTGNITVGSGTNSAGVHIFKNGATTTPFKIFDSDPVASQIGVLNFSADTDPSGGAYLSFQRAGLGEIGSITAATASTVAFNTSSDARMKENVVDMSGAVDKIKLIRPVTYNWIESGYADIGYLAQELHAVCPEVVRVGGDIGQENVENNRPWGIDYGKLTPVIVSALKEIIARVEALETP